jgi:hypothetical protein
MYDVFLNAPILVIPRANFLLIPGNHTFEVHAEVCAHNMLTDARSVCKMENQTFSIRKSMPMYFVGKFVVDPDYGTTITKNFTFTLEVNESCWHKDMKYEV